MSNKVYSFTKVRKQHTNSGSQALAAGILSLSVLIFFMGYGVYKGGSMSGTICLIPYVTMAVSIVYSMITERNIRRTDVAGKHLHSGHRICILSSVLHVVVFIVGVLKIIM